MDDKKDTGLYFLDYWRVIRSRKEIVLTVILLVVLTGVSFTFTLPKIYKSEARISIHQDSLDIDVFERQMMPGYSPFFLRTQYEIIQSRPLLYQVIDDLSLQQIWGEERNKDGAPISKKAAYSTLKKSLKIEQYRETDLIALMAFREEPQEAARIANQLAEVYKEQRLSVKRSEIKRGLDALKNELYKQQEKVDQAESDLEKIRKELGVHLLDQGVRADKLTLQDLARERGFARKEMLVKKARLDEIESLSADELIRASSYFASIDPALGPIRQSLIQAEVERKLKLEILGENHPDARQLDAARKELTKKLEETLEGLRIGLRTEYKVGKAKFEALEEELDTAREADIDSERERFLPFQKAERELLVQLEILNALRARIAQEGIELEIPRTPVELVEPAEVSDRPVSPNLFLNILLSLFLGIGAGVGIAYFIEYLDTSVKTIDDVERYLELSVLGVIPQKVKPLTQEGPESPHAESYRVLRTNMLFANKGMGGGSFAVVSGGVGEGKSTTLFNLAYICAQLGDKVLIVNSDLRRPTQHTMMGLSNRVGLSDVLMNNAPLEEMVKPTEMPNLHFLPSGKTPRSSMGLLDSKRMRELVKNLKARYDYVFFDSPPVGISDASILASEVDGVLFVVQYRKYPRVVSARAKRLIENVGGNIVGAVLNNINIMKDDYYYYYHSYYSDYYNEEQSNLESDPEMVASVQETKNAL
ncbi:MAG: polysaccharide biosynthesis tyrosine autokinase [Kiritimatiellae bacterium]|nr:polysaccharide biosynthesis tyrosine autokinase [Kiritimatiellia bacterium]